MRYDPDHNPDPEEWLELDEQERAHLIEKYHRKAGIRLPNRRLHAMTHAIIENQLATGEQVVRDALARLRAEGLSRHDAIHAIGWVLMTRMQSALGDVEGGVDLGAAYLRDLEDLTARRWLEEAGSDRSWTKPH